MSRLAALNPLVRLRPRLIAIVLCTVGALTVHLGVQSAHQLSQAYHEAGRSELRAIAATLDDGYRGTDTDRPDRLQLRIEQLKRNNPNLHKISLSWHDERGRPRLVQAGHLHEVGGKVDVTRPIGADTETAGLRVPFDLANYGDREVHAPDGAHYLELIYPVRRDGRLVAALELHYDLAKLDALLAASTRRVGITAATAGIVLALVLTIMLGRAVLRPLAQLRQATNRLRSGDQGTRLAWPRRDEIGDLARDFDRMADELQEALKDPLTGLLNHRAFQERLGEELGRARREGYPVSVVALDLDDFKEINDHWGHACGDEALRVLSRAIAVELRPSDFCGRVGGDEFMIGVVHAGAEVAGGVVARVRAALDDVRVGPGQARLMISAGIAEYPRHSDVQEELLHLADGAMYWAKSDGKDRCTVFSSDTDLALSPAEAAERNLRAGLVNTVHALARAVDAKDGYTHQHSRRVALYAVALAERLGLAEDRLERIRTAGVLHDVGKIGIADEILLAPRALSDDEVEQMRRHSVLGHDIISGAGMEEVADWVLHLHERWDGGGYPAGLAGDAIPLESRVLHAADALEAMTSTRVYRPAMPLDAAMAELERSAGTAFDPRVVAALLELLRSGVLVVSEDGPAVQSYTGPGAYAAATTA